MSDTTLPRGGTIRRALTAIAQIVALIAAIGCVALGNVPYAFGCLVILFLMVVVDYLRDIAADLAAIRRRNDP